MKNSLGKIVFLIGIWGSFLYGEVVLNAPETFYQGESIEFSITADGQNIIMPDIQNIENFPVQNLGTATQTNIINGIRTDKYIKRYSFVANKEVTIPAFEVQINGKTQSTQPKKLKMLSISKTISDDFDLTITVDKNEMYVGESIAFELLFKYKKDLNIVGLEFTKPTFDGFWAKEIGSNQQIPDDAIYSYQKLHYILFPQRAGKISIFPLKIEAITTQNQYRSSFFLSSPTHRTKIYSNQIDLEVKPLPENIKLIGDFQIEATIDKSELNEGEALSYKVSIKGRGNVDDIDEVKLNIPHATVYENPSEKKYNLENNLYGGEYTKAFSIVPTQSFTLPSIVLRYFDKNTQSMKEIATQSFDIKVKSREKKSVLLETQTEIKEESQNSTEKKVMVSEEKWFYFSLGFLGGVGGILLLIQMKKRKQSHFQEETPLVKKVKKTKNSRELLKLLTPYLKIDEDLDKIIFQLEHTKAEENYSQLQKGAIKILKNLASKGSKSDLL